LIQQLEHHHPRTTRNRVYAAIIAWVTLVACAGAAQQGTERTAPALRLEFAHRYGCTPGTVADTVLPPILTWLQVGVGTEPCELLAHYPALPRILPEGTRAGLLRQRWEFYFADPGRHWDIFFEGATQARLRAVELTEPKVRS
jgi:hypothetical protein